jgi:Holliday junction DNA helicase RuvA
VSDAVSGLVNLGYGRTEAYGAVIEALREMGDDARVEALIRGGLARLGAAA